MKKKAKKKIILVPTSGGKDSQLCLQLAIQRYGKMAVFGVFNDTQWDHPLTYAHLDYMREAYGVGIYATKGFTNTRTGEHIGGIKDAIIKNGKFPHGSGRFCTMYLKQYALAQWFKHYVATHKTIDNLEVEMWFGMRSAESSDRRIRYAGKLEEELYDANDVFPARYPAYLRKHFKIKLPILSMGTETVFNLIAKAGYQVNPLYEEGTNNRVGCYPCMLASKKVQTAMLSTPFGEQRILEIKELEEIIGKKYEMYDTDQGSCEVCKI